MGSVSTHDCAIEQPCIAIERRYRYFAAHPVFTYDEVVAAHASMGKRSPQTSATSLKQHVAAGNLLRIRRGLYASIHRGVEFLPVQAPVAVRNLPDLGGGVGEKRHAGGVVRVATLERTLVDVLDRPDKGGGWEEVWRSLEMVEFFDLDAVIDYALRLGSALTVARLGFFLEQHRETLMVEDRHLDALRAHAPAQPRYFDSARESGKLVTDWNLVVPERVLERAWEEVARPTDHVGYRDGRGDRRRLSGGREYLGNP
ncbi:MAG: hypothetical protein V3T74_11380 [Gemmatimonadales bacterium]